MESPRFAEIPLCHDHRNECFRGAALKQLRSSGYPALWKIERECVEGVLILRGRVPSYYLKQLAQVRIQRLARSRAVKNLLDVR